MVPTHQALPPVAPQPQHQTAVDQPAPSSMGQPAPNMAAGVAVGSTIGHTMGAGILGMFGGSGSSALAKQA
ncbi:hypothetical protein BC938DRAFT_474455 [Jimgerdemannia flammicorona]|uniref:Uncharacterized protein n=1 Tax=Jimgerdemannia flammicorona TaxID=994334 RepID=A0A433Q292_9FUNG|nr:hypothetical protein BC938DRAFT_474455 [Jimgerdemannia flammicorona]